MINAVHAMVVVRRQGSLLLVSADRQWLASATAFLAGSASSLSTAETAAEAIESAMSHAPDVAVIAPPIADSSAVALIAQLSVLREQSPLGIVYVAEREREVAEHSRLMRAGANDWFPRGLPVVDAARRITALLEEIRNPTAAVIRGPLRIDPVTRVATVGGDPLALTAAEFAILEALVRAAGRVLSPEDLATRIGARRGSRTATAIGSHVATLQAKLGAARGLLESSRRHDFRLRFVAPS